MPTTRESMNTYVAAWDTADPEKRCGLLEHAMTGDAMMVYPWLEARGWEDISAAIGGVHQQVPGMRVVPASGIEEHHGWVRASWRLLEAKRLGPLAGRGRS